MMTETGKEARAVGRLNSVYTPDPWIADGKDVRCAGDRLLECQTEGLAEYVARLHNIYLPVYNRFRWLIMRYADLQEVSNGR